MSEFVDTTLGRYLDQQPGMREALLKDPVQKMQVEALRKTLDMVERALIDEGVPEDARRRVVNRVVWGEPEGVTDVRARVREQAVASYGSMPSPEALRTLLDDAGPVRPDEEPT